SSASAYVHWLRCCCPATPIFRVFCPLRFGRLQACVRSHCQLPKTCLTRIRKPPPERLRPRRNHRDQSFPPAGRKRCAEMMSVSVAEIPKNRCRAMVGEPMEASACGTALYRNHVVRLGRDQAAQSRPTTVACLQFVQEGILSAAFTAFIEDGYAAT